MKRCPRCGAEMEGDFCRICGGGAAGRWQAPELELEKEHGRYAKMFEAAPSLHRCWVCGMPITADMLKSGEAKLEQGRYLCKLHAGQRERALKAIISSAAGQRRWSGSLDARSIGTLLAVIVMVAFGVAFRTCHRAGTISSLLGQEDDLSRRARACAAYIQDVRLETVRDVGDGLYEAIITGTIRNLLSRPIHDVTIQAKLHLVKGRPPFQGETVIETLAPGKSVRWQVTIPLTRGQADLLQKSKPKVDAETVYAEW